MADALKKDPLAPIIPLVIKGREFGLAFNINTYDLYETAMEKLCGPCADPDEGYSFFDAFGRILKGWERLQMGSTPRVEAFKKTARAAGATDEVVVFLLGPEKPKEGQPTKQEMVASLVEVTRANGATEEMLATLDYPLPGPTLNDIIRALKVISMRNLHAILWAAASEGERLRARSTGSKRVQFDIEDLGALLDAQALVDLILTIIKGQSSSSPRPGEVEEVAQNGDRPLPQIVIDAGEPSPGPSLVPEAGLG